MSGQTRAVLAILAANIGFGLVAAMIASLPVGGMVAVSVSFLAAGLVGVAWLRLRGGLTLQGVPLRAVLLISACNLVQGATYFAALRLASPGPVAALHLTSPILLLLLLVARGRRRFGWHELALMALVIVGLWACARASAAGTSDNDLGYLLSLVSAVAVAALFQAVSRLPADAPMLVVSALNQVLVGLVLVPFVVLTPPTVMELSALGLAGALVYFPGSVIVFTAIQRIGAVAVGALNLSEAVFAAAAASLLFQQPFSGFHGLAMAAILLAAILEHVGGPARTSRSSPPSDARASP